MTKINMSPTDIIVLLVIASYMTKYPHLCAITCSHLSSHTDLSKQVCKTSLKKLCKNGMVSKSVRKDNSPYMTIYECTDKGLDMASKNDPNRLEEVIKSI